MRIHNFAYLCKQGAKNVLSNKLMSFASIGVLVACFLLIGSAVLFTMDVNRIANHVGNQNEVSVFLDAELPESDIQVVDLELREMESILELQYYSREDALAYYSERMGTNLHEELDDPDTDNPMSPFYILRIGDSENFEAIMDRLEGIDGVIKVYGSPEVAKVLVAIQQTVMYAGIGIVLILVIVSVVIITNTIKLTVFSRRKEINIMKYVGATDVFIRLPFLVEGMLIGILAASLAFFLMGFGYTYLLNWLDESYGEIMVLRLFLDNAITFRDIALYIYGGFAVLGCFIGIVGSSMFVRKYLKV